jgi:hypothetical protein
MDANLKEIIAEMKAWRKEMTACEKWWRPVWWANPSGDDDVAEHQEVPKEEVEVETIRALVD